MKTKIWFLLGLVLAAALSVKAEDTHFEVYLQLYGTNFLKTVKNPISPTQYMGTNLTFRLFSKQGGYKNQFRADEKISCNVIPITPPGMNEVSYRAFPRNQAFDFHLFDQVGKEIPKTQEGFADSQPVRTPKSLADALNLHECDAPFGGYDMFRPDDMFVITNKGVYEMEVRLRIWAIVGFGPKTKDKISYPAWSLQTNAYYSVVTLGPVRASVIKE